jgi:hypothetical protein
MSQRLGPETRAIIDAINANRVVEQQRKGNLNYQTMLIDLSVARVDVEFALPGIFDHISVVDLNGQASIKLNKKTNDSIDLSWTRRIDTASNRFYLTNTAQVNKTLLLQIGGDASFTLDSDQSARTAVMIARENWMSDGNYPDRLEQGFRKEFYHGRTGAFYKSDAIANVPYRNWNLPTVLTGVNGLQVAPWNNAIDMTNAVGGAAAVAAGTAVKDEIYIGFPKAHFRMSMRVDLILPTLAHLGVNDVIGVGFELNSAGGHCNAVLFGGNGAYALEIVMLDEVTGQQTVTSSVAVTPGHLGVFCQYHFIWNFPNLTLVQCWAGTFTVLGLVTVVGLASPSKMIPFAANESATNIITDFQVGQVQVHELEKRYPMNLGVCSQVVSTNAFASALKITPFFKNKLIVQLHEHNTNDIQYQILASMDNVTYFTLVAPTVLLKNGLTVVLVPDPWLWLDVQIVDNVAATHGKLDCTIGGY